MKKGISLVLLAALLLGLPGLSVSAAGAADTGNLWLVNYDHAVPADYVPADLRYLSGSGQQLRAEAADAFAAMQAAAYAEGGGWLYPASGYRSYAHQSSLFYGRLADRQAAGMTPAEAWADVALSTAVPGTSEHQTGMAIDITQGGGLSQSFGETAGGRWLRDNSWRFGFILRYTGDKTPLTRIMNEPWHYRYVGVPHAELTYRRGWCWEEYMTALRAGPVTLDAGDGLVWEIFRTTDPAAYPGALSVSGDNDGGYIVTTKRPPDPLQNIRGHWSEASFEQLLDGRALPCPGAPDPEAYITRAEFAALYALLPLAETLEAPAYADVPAGAWYHDSVLRVSRAGVMRGSGGLFSPDAPLTRQEAATAAAALIADETLAYLAYSDLGSISGWAFQSVQKLTAHGIMGGYAGRFSPQAGLRWGEAAALLCRLAAYRETAAQDAPQM